jgi:hypothetical protein
MMKIRLKSVPAQCVLRLAGAAPLCRGIFV